MGFNPPVRNIYGYGLIGLIIAINKNRSITNTRPHQSNKEGAIMEVAMLTTSDNPYDPFTQFDEWYAFDERKG